MKVFSLCLNGKTAIKKIVNDWAQIFSSRERCNLSIVSQSILQYYFKKKTQTHLYIVRLPLKDWLQYAQLKAE